MHPVRESLGRGRDRSLHGTSCRTTRPARAHRAREPARGVHPPRPRRRPSALDLTGWSFDARLYGQRGGVLASGLAVTVTGNVVEVEIPEPGELLFTPAVLRVEAETAGAILALGYPTVAIETLLIAPET